MNDPQPPLLDANDVRAFVAIQCLGLATALEEGVFQSDDAGRWLFRAGMEAQVRALGGCKGCQDLVALGHAASHDGFDTEAIADLRARALRVLQVTVAAGS